MESKRAAYMRACHAMLMVGALSTAGCASDRAGILSAYGAICESGQICVLEGKLSAGSPWEAQLETKSGCVATAIPESFASVSQRFNNKRVQVVGKAFSQPSSTPEAEMYYYLVRGMRVNVNTCHLALMVFSIESTNGDKWVNEEQGQPEIGVN